MWPMIVLYAASIAADGYITQHTQRKEVNPFARPFVHSTQGEVIGCSLGFAAGVVPYFIMRKKHPKIARTWLELFTVPETANAIRQEYFYQGRWKHE